MRKFTTKHTHTKKHHNIYDDGSPILIRRRNSIAIASTASTDVNPHSRTRKAMKSSCLCDYFWVQRIVLSLTNDMPDVHNGTVIQRNVAAISATLQSTMQRRGDDSLPFGLNMCRCSESQRCDNSYLLWPWWPT